MNGPPIARALDALTFALRHVPVENLTYHGDERQLLICIPVADDSDPVGDQLTRTFLLTQLAERMNLPEPHASRIHADGARLTTSDTPAYCSGVTVVVWTPVTAGLAVSR